MTSAARLAAGATQVLNFPELITIMTLVMELALMVVALRFLVHVFKQNWTAVLIGLGIVMVALAVFGLAKSGDINAVSHVLYRTIFSL
jgi:hypothetical protein